MDILVENGTLTFNGVSVPCALGKNGLIAANQKREGDGCSPLGIWPLRYVMFRPDRVVAPDTRLPLQAMDPMDGWCDQPDHPQYNRPVRLPFDAGHEQMWREDGLYDVVVVLGHNDDPPQPHMGSAIFLHVAKPGYLATRGCVALDRDHLLALLAVADLGDNLVIR